MKVLITGAGGSIGRIIGHGLSAHGHDLRALDRAPRTDLDASYDLGWISGDCLDAATVDRAVEGVDAVVHLAGNPDEASLPDCLDSHVLTTARLLEAMVAHNVGRIAYASSNHAVGHTPRTALLSTDVRPRPDTFYGVAKVAGEALLSLYADRYGLCTVAMRIGSFLPEPTSKRNLATWLSPDDAVRMVNAAISVTEPGWRVMYGISANSGRWWDLAPGRAIGFDPHDDAQAFADCLPDRAEDPAENARVGGPQSTERFVRPAF